VPIYEFRCPVCGERFEALVDAGAEALECRACGAGRATRVFSAPSPPAHLLKSGGGKRKQEQANAKLRADTKARFSASRRRSR